MMNLQIAIETQTAVLKALKVIKRDGTPTNFYPYKIKLVLQQLGADQAVSDFVFQSL